MKNNKSALIDQKVLWLMLIPVILYFFIFKYLPLGGLVIAFKRFSPFRGVIDSPWVGLMYFKQFFSSIYFSRVLRNTLVIGVLYLTVAFPVPIILALMLNSLKAGIFKKTTQTITLLPHFVSFVVIAGIAVNFLSPSTGVVNAFLEFLGFDSIYFMQEPDYFWGIYTFIRIFKESGYESIVYLAALSAIDLSLYESASLDGASSFQKLRHITIPSIAPTIIIMFLVRVGQLVTVSFEEVLLLQNDVILSKAEVISTLVYRRGLVGADYSYATAIGVLESAVALCLILISNTLARRFSNNESSLW